MGWQQYVGKSIQDLGTQDCLALCEWLDHWAPWLLDDSILRRAEQHYQRGVSGYRKWLTEQPTLPTRRGGCWIICVRQQEIPILKKQFLLPAQWAEAISQDHCLPAKVIDLSEKVCEQVKPKLPDELRGKKYVLQSAVRSNVDLSDLDISPDSGWASLVGGLMSYALGGHSDHEIWTSAAWSWSDKEVVEVGQLKDKIDLAVQYNVKKLFVPSSQKIEAEKAAQEGLEINEIKQECVSWDEAIHDYLRCCTVPPGIESSLAERVGYYLHQSDSGDADRYYRDFLLDEIAEVIRGKLPDNVKMGEFKHYFACVSHVNIVALGARVSRAACLHLFYTADKQHEVDQLKKIFPAVEIKEYACSDKQVLYEKLQEEGQKKDFSEQYNADECVIDLLPGDKYMSILLIAGWPDSWKMFFQQGHEINLKRSDPREIMPHLWQGARNASS